MKAILAVFFTISLVTIFAQTPLIGHKSHSGKALNYFIDPNSNFGIDVYTKYGEKTVKYDKLTDTTVLRNTINRYDRIIYRDTLMKPKSVSYRKFKKTDLKTFIESPKMKNSMSYVEVNTSKSMEMGESVEKRKPEVAIPVSVVKQPNQPSFLLIFVAVSAFGMIVMRLFSIRTAVTN